VDGDGDDVAGGRGSTQGNVVVGAAVAERKHNGGVGRVRELRTLFSPSDGPAEDAGTFWRWCYLAVDGQSNGQENGVTWLADRSFWYTLRMLEPSGDGAIWPLMGNPMGRKME
jgi:hypothetical protein